MHRPHGPSEGVNHSMGSGDQTEIVKLESSQAPLVPKKILHDLCITMQLKHLLTINYK